MREGFSRNSSAIGASDTRRRHLCAFENPVGQSCGPDEALAHIRAIGHETAIANVKITLVDGWEAMGPCELEYSFPIEDRQWELPFEQPTRFVFALTSGAREQLASRSRPPSSLAPTR
jgi:hypothetical protein